MRHALRAGARRSASGAAAPSRRRLELRRDRRAARDSRQRRQDARVPRDEEDEGAPEVRRARRSARRDRARSEAGAAACAAVDARAGAACRSRSRSCSPSRCCTSSAPTSRALGFGPRAGAFPIAQALAGVVIVAAGAARIDSGPRAVARRARRGRLPAASRFPPSCSLLTASTFDIGPAPGRALTEGPRLLPHVGERRDARS